MAGRVPVGADRTAVAMEMEATFVQNLKHAADVLSKVSLSLALLVAQSQKGCSGVEQDSPVFTAQL